MHDTTNYGLCYQVRQGLDRVVDIHSGYVFNLFGREISWMRKIHAVVELSTTEDEYMVATHASKEAVWLNRLCSVLGWYNKQ